MDVGGGVVSGGVEGFRGLGGAAAASAWGFFAPCVQSHWAAAYISGGGEAGSSPLQPHAAAGPGSRISHAWPLSPSSLPL